MSMNLCQGMGTAVVTGASSGIGAIYADRMAGRGYDVVPGARNERRLGDFADRVGAAHGRSVTVVIADLTVEQAFISRKRELGRSRASRCW